MARLVQVARYESCFHSKVSNLIEANLYNIHKRISICQSMNLIIENNNSNKINETSLQTGLLISGVKLFVIHLANALELLQENCPIFCVY